MKKQNNIVRFLVPAVAVIVLAESVMLISNLNASKFNKTVTSGQPQVVTSTVTPVESGINNAVYAVTVTTATKEMKLNQAGIVEVKAIGNADKALDAVNIYLKYDPAAFEISNLTFDKKLPAATFSKVSQTTGLVVANFLISTQAGLKVNSGDVLSLMKFSAKPIKTGVFSFEISTGKEMKESATMFVENATSKILPFSTSGLTVNVSR
jgi:hypothetical protein